MAHCFNELIIKLRSLCTTEPAVDARYPEAQSIISFHVLEARRFHWEIPLIIGNTGLNYSEITNNKRVLNFLSSPTPVVR